GVTTIQGTSPGSTCIRTLIRNAENQANLAVSANHIRTFILDIGSFKGGINWSATKSFVVHLAEGVRGDPTSLAEFTTLKAKALPLDAFIGRIAPGLKADITVLRVRDDDPTKSLLKTHLQDVQMVWVGGDLLYANKAILEKIKPGECEAMLVYGSQKRVCV